MCTDNPKYFDISVFLRVYYVIILVDLPLSLRLAAKLLCKHYIPSIDGRTGNYTF